MLKFQEELAKKHNYKKLDNQLSKEVREKYVNDLVNIGITSLGGRKDCCVYTVENTLIAVGYNKIVVGDYGAFIEIDKKDLVFGNIKVKEGQEYRFEEKYKSCKYYWLTAKDNSNIKVYHQKHCVDYARYEVDKIYVSPYEVILK